MTIEIDAGISGGERVLRLATSERVDLERFQQLVDAFADGDLSEIDLGLSPGFASKISDRVVLCGGKSQTASLRYSNKDHEYVWS